jgi:hypothetical protein
MAGYVKSLARIPCGFVRYPAQPPFAVAPASDLSYTPPSQMKVPTDAGRAAAPVWRVPNADALAVKSDPER